MRLWNTANWKMLRVMKLQPGDESNGVCAVSFSPDGSLIAAGGGYAFSKEEESWSHGVLKIWRVSDWSEWSVMEFPEPLPALAFSPDGAYLAYGMSYFVHLWDIKSRKEVCRFQAKSQIWDVTFSPNGARMASASDEGTIRLWKRSK